MTATLHPQVRAAITLLKKDADPRVVATADALIAEGRARWALDPYVDLVVGLVDTSDEVPASVDRRQKAWIIVYLDEDLRDGDWEVSDEFWIFEDLLHLTI